MATLRSKGFTQARRTLLLTRPKPEAKQWASALRDSGYAVELLPLIETCPPTAAEDQKSLRYWREHWPTASAVMTVSPAAVRWFFGSETENPRLSNLGADLSSTRWWCPGPGTANVLKPVLKGLGVSAAKIDSPGEDAPQFDSEALWKVVQQQVTPHSRILVVRGRSRFGQDGGFDAQSRPEGDGRQWLLDQCRIKGAEVHTCVAYERRSVLWSEAQLSAARNSDSPGTAWIFSSSESIELLQQRLAGHDWSGSTALATHPRIASAATALGFGVVISCRPGLSDVRSALESHWSPTQ